MRTLALILLSATAVVESTEQRAFFHGGDARRLGARAGPAAEEIFAHRQLSSTSAPLVYFAGYSMCGKLNAAECDAHAVYGIPTSDGGYAVTGKYMAAGTAPSAEGTRANHGGFVLKQIGDPSTNLGVSAGAHVMLDNAEVYSQANVWTAQFENAGHWDGGNTVAEVGTDLYVGGYQWNGGESAVKAVIKKYDPTLGNGPFVNSLKWMVFLGTGHGAVEVCQPTSDGGLVCTGVTNVASEASLEGFKSYGNPEGGTMFVVKYSAAHLASTTAPTSPTFYKTYSSFQTGKGIRELPAGGYVIGTHTSDAAGNAAVVKLDASGNLVWSKQYAAHGEVTDIALLTDGSIALSGHTLVAHADGGGYDGHITKFTADGNFVWSKTVGNPSGGQYQFASLPDAGNPTLIYDECWGIQALPNGAMVASCGTGIEGCGASVIKNVPLATCEADPRTVWRSYVIALDSSGGTQWSRVDSYAEAGDNNVGTTAAEYVAVDQSGDLYVTTDQLFGVGMIKLDMPDPTAAPTAAPIDAPTMYPTDGPTPPPTPSPTKFPTDAPTPAPTTYPTPAPTQFPTLEATKTMAFDVSFASETVSSFTQAKQDSLKLALVAVLGNGVQTSDITLTITAASPGRARRLSSGIDVAVEVKAKLASSQTVENAIKASGFPASLQTKAVEQGVVSSAADLSADPATSFRVVTITSDAPSAYPTVAVVPTYAPTTHDDGSADGSDSDDSEVGAIAGGVVAVVVVGGLLMVASKTVCKTKSGDSAADASKDAVPTASVALEGLEAELDGGSTEADKPPTPGHAVEQAMTSIDKATMDV